MNKGEIIQRFREDNPEITTNVVSDAVLQDWCEVGNQEIAIRTRLVKGEGTFNSVAGQSTYNLVNEITKFYDIDEYPGAGVFFDNDQLEKTTPAALSEDRPSWKTQTSGTPKKYFRRNNNIILYQTPSQVKQIEVYCVLLPDELDDDNKDPFNELPYLEPFHYSLVLYLKKRTFMGKVKKLEAAQIAQQEYENYLNWMNREINRGIQTPIKIRPPRNYRGVGRMRSGR